MKLEGVELQNTTFPVLEKASRLSNLLKTTKEHILFAFEEPDELAVPQIEDIRNEFFEQFPPLAANIGSAVDLFVLFERNIQQTPQKEWGQKDWFTGRMMGVQPHQAADITCGGVRVMGPLPESIFVSVHLADDPR